MRLFFTSLIVFFSLSALGSSVATYRGSGVELQPDGAKLKYSIVAKMDEQSTGSYKLVTIETKKSFDNGNIVIQTLRLLVTGTDSFTIIDKDGDKLGWGYEIEFEREGSPKVHALVLNYRKSDKTNSDTVAHLVRFTKADGTMESTGSIVDQDGEVVFAWSHRGHQKSTD